MRSTCFIPVIVCLLLFVAYNNAQAPICSDRCAVPLTTCSLVTYKVYTTNLTNITANEEGVQSVLDRIPANDTLCRTLVNQFACAITYPACNITQRPAVPQRPCVKLCTDFRASCLAYAPFFPASLQRYINCSGVDTTGAPLYGNLSVVVNVTNGNVTTNVTTYTQCFPLTNTRPQCNALRSGSCLTWNVTQAPRTGELCGPFISTTVYGAQAISATDAIAFTGAIQFIQPYFSILPLGCYKALMSFICGNFFPDCHLEYIPEFNQTLALPSKPCKSICDTRLALCADFFTDLNVTLSLACGTVPPGPIVNMTVSNTPDTNVPVQTTCRSEIIPINASAPYYLPPFDQCPVVLGRKNNPSEELNEPRCTLKCPDASYTASEWSVLVQLTRVGASLSLITMTFLLVSYLVHYDKRRFPLSIHIWEFVSCLFLALAFLLNGSAPEENVWCDDPGTFATQSSNSRCGAQGFLFIMFGLSVATWCCVIAFIMFRAIVFNKKVKDMESFTIYFHLFGWGVPLVFAITALATNSIGYGAPLAWCFIQFSGFGFGSTYSGISIDYYVFYIPIGVLFVIIIVMFWLTVAKIVQVRRLQVAKNSTRKKSSRTLQAQIRVLLFIFVVYIICFTIFEWRFQIEAENSRHNFDAIGFDWIVCKIKREVNNSTKFEFGNCPDDVPPARINYPHTGAESFLISAVGFFMFFAFGSDLGIYRHWKKLIILATQREWRQLVDFIRFGKDPFNPTSTGTKTKTSDSSNSSAVKNDDKPKRPPNGVARSDLSTTSVEEDTGTSTAPPPKTGGPQMYYLA